MGQLIDLAQYREPWVTRAQLAQHLGMSERWISLQVAAGMPSRQFGRARRFRVSECERWLGDRAS